MIHPQLDRYLSEGDKEYLQGLAESLNARLEWETSDLIHINDYHFYSSLNQKVIEV